MDWQQIIKAAKAQGWAVEETKRHSLRLVPPDPSKEMVQLASSPSDVRACETHSP